MNLIKPKNCNSQQPKNSLKSSTPKPNTHLLKHPPTIYEVEEVRTQSIMLPYANNEHIQFLTRNNSELSQSKEKYSRYNLASSERMASPTSEYQMRAASRGHPLYTRETFYEMNKKTREIRTSHYKSKKSNENLVNLEYDLELDRPILTAREVHLSHQKIFARKNIMTTAAGRAVNQYFKNSQEILTPKRANSTQEIRQKWRQKISRNEYFKASQPRPKNPHVIYPFQSKLKVHRIDDNPKILGNIIRKKFKEMQKEDLYLYINGIIHRREQ